MLLVRVKPNIPHRAPVSSGPVSPPIKSDIYESLLLQTRFASYFDKLDIAISNDQVVLNTQGIEAAFKTAIANNPQAGMIDLAEFISAAGPDNLKNIPDQTA